MKPKEVNFKTEEELIILAKRLLKQTKGFAKNQDYEHVFIHALKLGYYQGWDDKLYQTK